MSLDALEAGLIAHDLASLGRALTLVESDRDADVARATALLTRLLPRTGGAKRIGISGVPGVGKSTLIDALGMSLLDAGSRVAVLSIDPSSGQSGGSILGDKTRMARLGRDPRAFIRPSPNRGALGGVTRTTREAILVLEAAGYDVILVETVGVGQAELEVARMVDTFVLLMLPNAGDELQGIKRGILEHAHLVVINKADGEAKAAAEVAKRRYAAALALFPPIGPEWTTEVLTASAVTGDGIEALRARIAAHQDALDEHDVRVPRRREQSVAWMHDTVEHEVLSRLRREPALAARRAALEEDVRQGRLTPMAAARALLEAYYGVTGLA